MDVNQVPFPAGTMMSIDSIFVCLGKNGWTGFSNFDLKIFVGVQGRFNSIEEKILTYRENSRYLHTI